MSAERAQLSADGVEHASEQFLTFVLAGEDYGVDILRVQEITGWEPPTKIPNTPDYIKGVTNLRGTVVPIIDLRARFKMDVVEYTSRTAVIVLKIHADDHERIFGFIVDAVSTVQNINPDDVKETPDLGAGIGTEFIKGLATVEDKVIILLEIDKLVAVDLPDT